MGDATVGRKGNFCNRFLTSGFEQTGGWVVGIFECHESLIKPNLGRLLFPGLSPDQRRREMRVMVITLVTGLVIAGAMALVMARVAEAKLF